MTTTALAADQRTPAAGGAAPRLPRGRRTVAAVIVAVLLLLLAGYAAWQAILVQLGQPTYPLDAASISQNLNQTPWNHLAVTITGVVLALLGLWLLLLAITPARRKFIELREPHPDVATGIRPADLRRAVDGAAMRIDGISNSRTVLGRRTATTTVTSPLGNPEGLTEKVTAAVTDQITELDPLDPLTPKVKLTGKDR